MTWRLIEEDETMTCPECGRLAVKTNQIGSQKEFECGNCGAIMETAYGSIEITREGEDNL